LASGYLSTIRAQIIPVSIGLSVFAGIAARNLKQRPMKSKEDTVNSAIFDAKQLGKRNIHQRIYHRYYPERITGIGRVGLNHTMALTGDRSVAKHEREMVVFASDAARPKNNKDGRWTFTTKFHLENLGYLDMRRLTICRI